MWLVYEQPLNETIRSYLRIEAVYQQAGAHALFPYPGTEVAFFRTLFELGELMERTDLRSDLIKDLDRQLQHIDSWRPLPSVDHQQLDRLEQRLKRLSRELQQLTRPTQPLKEDRFLGALRQRLSIPGGYGSFDLPQLHHWLARPAEQKAADAQYWLKLLAPITASVENLLMLLRDRGQWQEQMAINGAYQASSPQEVDLLRVKLKQEYGVYPAISAHRNRFTIHLINNETGKADPRNLPIQIHLSTER
ncbi:cell division protein ZapD [Ferrimonas gelatinilytica]|uniref:Cell division protein ZapD n=1 Tax=Ferrimonas gelatinilytica TaxID=1255257 RepID=A0ABP9SCR0_9GAMM